MSPLVIANWKMYGTRRFMDDFLSQFAALLESGIPPVQIAFCVPATLLSRMGIALSKVPFTHGNPVALGGQDCHHQDAGAFTGDVSAQMLHDVGCRYVIVGHSERRAYHGETDEVIAGKAQKAHAEGLTSVICIGELLEQRQQGQTIAVLEQQLSQSIPASASPENTVIAYEPVWAIGTGLTPSEQEVEQVHRFIYAWLHEHRGGHQDDYSILYGGSVKPGNAGALFQVPYVDGFLVGGASLSAPDFWQIIQATCQERVAV